MPKRDAQLETYEMIGRMSIAIGIIEQSPEIAGLVPEVRMNLVYAKNGATTAKEVLGVEGRITVVSGRPKASGAIQFGASSHLARFVLGMLDHDPKVRSAVNFANDKMIIRFLEEYCRKKRWSLVAIDRSLEPPDIFAEEGRSVPWKVEEVLRATGGKVPEVAYENGAIGKEPVSVLIGNDPVELATRLVDLANAFTESRMAKARIGKVHPEVLNSIILRSLGHQKKEVLIGPRTGGDAAVIGIGMEKALIIAEDPIFTVPGMDLEAFGWATVHIGASDVAVMGVEPQFMTYSLLLPIGTSDTDLEAIVSSISDAAKGIGVSIVGGHTGYYPGLAQPLIGGVTVLAITDYDKYVTSAGARVGNDILLTKGPAIEATAALALLRKERLSRFYPEDLVQRAINTFWKMSVVEDARLAMGCGGVTAMHDATEGGVIGGLWEMADASGVGMEVIESQFVYPDEVRMVCEGLGLDPIEAISEGSLLVTCDPSISSKILHCLQSGGIEASKIGKVVSDINNRVIIRRDGTVAPLRIPDRDPFWQRFFE